MGKKELCWRGEELEIEFTSEIQQDCQLRLSAHLVALNLQ